MAQLKCVDNYPLLSRPVDSMRTAYDVVVVGSGYGAGVAASRMARAGKSVAVLELGWERRRMQERNTLATNGLLTGYSRNIFA
jgi:choline dehydrogenase-like flavoprotein